MTPRFVQATLVVPTGPNQGSMSVHDYDSALRELEAELLAAFGGFTAVDGHGASWDGSTTILRESVRVYTLALSAVLVDQALLTLRERVKVLLDQRTVYLSAVDTAEKPVY